MTIKNFLTLIVTVAVFSLSAKDYIITDYGVQSDSTLRSTEAIQKVIDLAETEGGGTIIFPKGTFLSGALFFRPNTKLELQEGAKLKGSDDIADYPYIPSRMEGKSIYYYAALVNAYQVDGFSITGPGKIDGNGLKFWKAFWQRRAENPKCTNLEVSRPRMLFIWGCNDVVIRNVKLHNAGFWTTHLYQCNNVLIEGCDIRSPHEPIKAPSTDAVDIDVCKNVTVRGCYIAVNDDAIVMKGGKGPTAHEEYENGTVENVLVEDCTFGFVHATLTMGSECIHAKNITMRNCVVDHDKLLLRLKIRPDTYQLYEDITVESITGRCENIIYAYSWKQFFNMEGMEARPNCTIRNITMKNIDVECDYIGTVKGKPEDTFENIVLENINLKVNKEAFEISEGADIHIENMKVNGKEYSLE